MMTFTLLNKQFLTFYTTTCFLAASARPQNRFITPSTI